MQEEKSYKEIIFTDFLIPFTSKKAIFLIWIIGFVVFANALFAGFVWDDYGYILLNQPVHFFPNILNSFSPNMFNSLGLYRPVNFAYFTLLYALFHETAFFYHLLGVSLHILNATLVFLCFQKVFNRKLSFFLSLLFLVHPMQVESSTFIATSGDRLFILCGLLAFYVSLGSVLSVKKIVSIGILLTVSLLAKETGVLFMVMMFLVNLKKIETFKKIITVSTISIAVYALLRFGVGRVFFGHPQSLIPIGQLSLMERLSHIPVVVWYYLYTFFYPKTLIIMQIWTMPAVNVQYFYAPLILDSLFFLLTGLFGLYLYRKNRKRLFVYLFFFVWFFLGLFMHVQIFALDMTVADRWFYFPMAGLLGMAGIGVEEVVKRTKKDSLIFGLLGITVCLFGARTIIRNQDWMNVYTLYTHDSKLSENFMLENNLGWYYQTVSNYPEALKHYKKSYALNPVGPNISNLVTIYTLLKDTDNARLYAYKLIGSKNYPDTLKNQYFVLAAWMLLENDTGENTKLFIQKELEEKPELASLWAYNAVVLYREGNYEEALSSSKKAQALSSLPPYKDLYNIISLKKTLPEKISLLLP